MIMLIGNDSPLRRLPSGLNLKQTLFFDAIRYSVEMADMAYSRLQETLISLAHEYIEAEKVTNIGSAGVNAMLDAWSVVDSIHRLRSLLKHSPYTKQNSPGLVAFYKNTTVIDTLRHIIQHINKEIDKLVVDQAPVLGSLSWFVRPEPSGDKLFLCHFQPGSFFKRNVPIIRMPHIVGFPIDKITLNHNQSICINDIMNQVKKLISSIEKQLQDQTKDLPRTGSDILIILELKEGRQQR